LVLHTEKPRVFVGVVVVRAYGVQVWLGEVERARGHPVRLERDARQHLEMTTQGEGDGDAEEHEEKGDGHNDDDGEEGQSSEFEKNDGG
jgi:hypothetical protein